jgi:DNA-binding transcriptional MerR regulator
MFFFCGRKMSDIVTATQLAKRLQVKPQTIRRWHTRGLIPGLRRISFRPILFDFEEVRKALTPKKRGRQKK